MYIRHSSNACTITKSDINDAHNNYMGDHVDAYEALLRSAFPGETEDFYEYGKWGGGVFNSSEYDALSDETRQKIENYLITNGLLK